MYYWLQTGFGLGDWIYWHLKHSPRNYRQYSAIADLHTLQFTVTHAVVFSVFISRILATDLSQSHCNFKLHMKSSSFHSLIPYFIIPQLPILRTRLNSIPLLSSSYPGRLASRNSTLHFSATVLYSGIFLYNHFARTTQKTQPLF
jgi:hypothetical protein